MKTPDVNAAGEYLWSARSLVAEAKRQLDFGNQGTNLRADLDRISDTLGRLAEDLRLMALAIEQPNTPEVMAWNAKRKA